MQTPANDYVELRPDTPASMAAAQSLYRSIGFIEIARGSTLFL
jgi:ribosomal protein S18 acetylase RimI-like enzyme